MARGAGAAAIGAEVAAAISASGHAVGAETFLASVATQQTRHARFVAAARTRRQFFAVDDRVADRTDAPVPLVKRDVSAVGVVGGEDLTGDEKEVQQPGVFPGGPQGDRALAGAERLAVDVRMRHVGARPGGRRVQCHDAERKVRTSQGRQSQPQLKPPQVDAFQHDRLSDDDQLVLAGQRHVAKLVFQGRKVAADLAATGVRRGTRRLSPGVPTGDQRQNQLVEIGRGAPPQPRRGVAPAAALSPLDLALAPGGPLPELGGPGGLRRVPRKRMGNTPGRGQSSPPGGARWFHRWGLRGDAMAAHADRAAAGRSRRAPAAASGCGATDQRLRFWSA